MTDGNNERLAWGRFTVTLSIGLALVAGLEGCRVPPTSWRGWQFRLLSREHSIQSIQVDPEAKSERAREVRLRGVVGDRVPLLDGQIYQLTDHTGSIWVVTTDTTVTSGEELLILGRVQYEAMPNLGNHQGETYVEELRQLRRR